MAKEYIGRDDARKVIEAATSMVANLLEATKKLCVAMNSIQSADVRPADRNTFHVIDLTTGDIPDCAEIALKEDWAQGLHYCDIDGFYLGEDGNLVLVDDCGKSAWCPAGRFKVVWEDGEDG